MRVVSGTLYIVANEAPDSYCTSVPTYKIALSADDGETFTSIDPASNYNPVATGTLFVNRLDKMDMWLIVTDGDDSGECKLLHSTDGGSSWTEVTNASDLFGAGCTMCNNHVATAPYVYEPNADVLCWSGRLKLGTDTDEFLFYSEDAGLTWLNKRGDWVTEFSDWLGDDQNVTSDRNQLVPLPRVGANE